MYDPIVSEVRKIRDAHSKKFNYNVSEIFKDYDNRHDEIINKLKNIKENFNDSLHRTPKKAGRL